jgi:hypothetical protein
MRICEGRDQLGQIGEMLKMDGLIMKMPAYWAQTTGFEYNEMSCTNIAENLQSGQETRSRFCFLAADSFGTYDM